ncbi:MAG: hypothetical protein JST68_20795 [Bacteroidetes bacterium]|nr:hypothetical protein [Bacteroidota bacterium]
MEHERIKLLLEKYWAAETSLEEEGEIALYFREGDVAPELEGFRAFFDYIEEENRVSIGDDFEKKILERLSPVRRFNFGLVAAAAALLICVSSLFLVVEKPAPPVVAIVEVRDTYDDPEKALAAVRKALLVASRHMNEGAGITEKNMDRLNNSWQAASFK